MTSRSSRATQDSVKRDRCQRSWKSTSATDAPNRFCNCAFADLTYFRLPFSDPASGKCNSTERMPTKPAPKVSAPRLRGRGGGCGRRVGEIRALDLPRLIGLEHVALPHVVLEPLQLGDRRLVDLGAVADDAHTGIPAHHAARHHATGDRAEPRH